MGLVLMQRRMSRAQKGTLAMSGRGSVRLLMRERIAHRRKDFAHQHSRRIVSGYGAVAALDLSINQIHHRRKLTLADRV